MMISATRRGVTILLVTAALAAGPSVVPVSATPSAEAGALARLKVDWDRYNANQKLGTCNAYRTAGRRMVTTAATDKWSKPGSHRRMTRTGWEHTYAKYFAWACSGPNKGPRP
jgi:hypothetical protein